MLFKKVHAFRARPGYSKKYDEMFQRGNSAAATGSPSCGCFRQKAMGRAPRSSMSDLLELASRSLLGCLSSSRVAAGPVPKHLSSWAYLVEAGAEMTRLRKSGIQMIRGVHRRTCRFFGQAMLSTACSPCFSLAGLLFSMRTAEVHGRAK